MIPVGSICPHRRDWLEKQMQSLVYLSQLFNVIVNPETVLTVYLVHFPGTVSLLEDRRKPHLRYRVN